MRAGHAVAAALAAAVALASVAAARPAAERQRVGIELFGLPSGTFVLTPLQAGRLRGDTGTVTHTVANYTPRMVMRGGQNVSVFEPVVWLLRGKRGNLTIQEPRNEWVRAAGGRDIGTGTWKVLRGTGQYAGLTGGGRTVHLSDAAGKGCWCVRQEGFLISP
jgi:hypothetical protein